MKQAVNDAILASVINGQNSFIKHSPEIPPLGNMYIISRLFP